MTVACEHLDTFFDGDLDADEADAFRRHLTGCGHCAEQLAGLIQQDLRLRREHGFIVINRRLISPVRRSCGDDSAPAPSPPAEPSCRPHVKS